MPVAASHASKVVLGRVSPADTHLRSEEMSCAASFASIARYAVGAVKATVAPNLAMAASRSSGDAFSMRIDAAPTRSGNKTSPPSPKVKASGGEPMKRSCASAHSTWRP